MEEPMTASISGNAKFALPAHRTRWNHRPLSRVYEQGVVYSAGRYYPLSDVTSCCLSHNARQIYAQATVSLWDGMFFCLDEVIDRIEALKKELKLRFAEPVDIRETIMMLAALGGLRDACTQVSLVAAPALKGSVSDPGLAEICAIAAPFGQLWDQEITTTMSAQIIETTRTDKPSSQGSLRISHRNCALFGAVASQRCEVSGSSTLIQSRDGYIVGGTSSHIFALVDGTWLSSSGSQFGCVVQGSVANLMRQMNLKIVEERVRIESLFRADEIFATTAAGGILPIAVVNNQRVGNGGHIATGEIFREFWTRRADGWRGSPAAYLPEI